MRGFTAVIALLVAVQFASGGPFHRNQAPSCANGSCGSQSSWAPAPSSWAPAPSSWAPSCSSGSCSNQAGYSWQTVDAEEFALMFNGKQVGNYRTTDKVFRPFDGTAWGAKCDCPTTLPTINTALDEVNARRARSGLRPFIQDLRLTLAAERAAAFRARHLIEGHSSNDFQFLPAGATATASGCAAWHPSMSWGSCCVEENHKFAGAAFVIGADGRRYMHLFVAD